MGKVFERLCVCELCVQRGYCQIAHCGLKKPHVTKYEFFFLIFPPEGGGRVHGPVISFYSAAEQWHATSRSAYFGF